MPDRNILGTALTMTLPLCETINRYGCSPRIFLVLATHFKIRLPEKLLSLAQQLMSLTLKVHAPYL